MLSVSIVNYHTPEMVVGLVKQLQVYHSNVEIIVSDNTNGKDAKQIEETGVKVLVNENIGFGKAHNRAIEQAKNEFIAIINPDIKINKYTLPKLVAFLQETEAEIVGPALYGEEGLWQQSCWDHPSMFVQLLLRRTPLKHIFKKRYGEYELKEMDLSKAQQVPWISGAFMVMKGKQYFDPKYFLYLEDADLCRERKVWYNPDARAVHAAQHGSKKNLKLFIHHLKSVMYYSKKHRR